MMVCCLLLKKKTRYFKNRLNKVLAQSRQTRSESSIFVGIIYKFAYI